MKVHTVTTPELLGFVLLFLVPWLIGWGWLIWQGFKACEKAGNDFRQWRYLRITRWLQNYEHQKAEETRKEIDGIFDLATRINERT